MSCDLSHEVCSFTLDGWLHGRKTKTKHSVGFGMQTNVQLYRYVNVFSSAQARPLVCWGPTTMKPGTILLCLMDLKPETWTVFCPVGRWDR